MEEDKIKLENAYIFEIQKIFKQTKQVEKYEDESLTTQTEFEENEKYGLILIQP